MTVRYDKPGRAEGAEPLQVTLHDVTEAPDHNDQHEVANQGKPEQAHLEEG